MRRKVRKHRVSIMDNSENEKKCNCEGKAEKNMSAAPAEEKAEEPAESNVPPFARRREITPEAPKAEETVAETKPENKAAEGFFAATKSVWRKRYG